MNLTIADTTTDEIGAGNTVAPRTAEAPLDSRSAIADIAHGGWYTVDNVVPACRSCNASKCESEVTIWMRRKRLDEAASPNRWLQVKAAA